MAWSVGLERGYRLLGMNNRYERPVPQIGDATSHLDRQQDPGAWNMGEQVTAALDDVIAARRDIRRYRADEVPEELVNEVLTAGHLGPSVGHSQPWRFIVVKDQALRDKAAVMADRERLRQAKLLTEDRASRLLDLQLEGIREAPLGVVVACDRRAPSSGVLGRNTFIDADMWSCAAAIENMWLAARARGLGMGWVTLFHPEELAEMLGLPEGVETLGWLCLGWPDERPPSPGLERRGWSKRLPLEDVVLQNRWPETQEPDAPISALREDLAEKYADLQVSAPGRLEVVDAHDSADQLLTPPGSLGKLDQSLDRLAAAMEQADSGTLVIVGADHPITRHNISAFDTSVTYDVMRASAAGTSLGAMTAKQVGLKSVTVDAGVAHGKIDGAIDMRLDTERGDIVEKDSMSVKQTKLLVERGIELGEKLSADGIVCLGEIGIGNTTVASALACALAGLSPEDAVGLGASSDSSMMLHKIDVLTRAFERTGELNDPIEALAAVGGPEFAVLTGVTLGASKAGSAVILDGLATSVAALAAVKISAGVQGWLLASHVSREHAHQKVLDELGLEPLLELRFRAGEGVGACYGAQMLMTGMRVRNNAAKWSPVV